MRAWSGLTGLREAFARLRDSLVVFRDERRRELFDVAEGPHPDPDVPAPPRFLPAFDNAVLGFDDRTRIIDDVDRGLSVEGARFVLVDGRVAATWTVLESGERSTLRVSMLRTVAPQDVDAVVEEGERLLSFLSDGGGLGRRRCHCRLMAPSQLSAHSQPPSG